MTHHDQFTDLHLISHLRIKYAVAIFPVGRSFVEAVVAASWVVHIAIGPAASDQQKYHEESRGEHIHDDEDLLKRETGAVRTRRKLRPYDQREGRKFVRMALTSSEEGRDLQLLFLSERRPAQL